MPGLDVGYYEARIIANNSQPYITIGIARDTAPTTNMCGLVQGSIGYHADDGGIFMDNTKQHITEASGVGDVIGVGVEFFTGNIFFTKNGRLIHTLEFSSSTRGKLFPNIGLKEVGQTVSCNFGGVFLYNIENHIITQGAKKDKSSYWDNIKTLNNFMKGFSSGDNDFGEEILDVVYAPDPISKTIGTPHPYANNSELEWSFVYPDVEYLDLEFNSQCKTEANYDYLLIYLAPNKQIPYPSEGHKYSGGDFPNEIRIPSNEVYLYFTSDGSNVEWGFEVTVKAPVVNEEGVNVLTEVQKYIGKWDIEKDIKLCSYINTICDKNKIETPWIGSSLLRAAEEFFGQDQFADLEDIDLWLERIKFLNEFNRVLGKAIPFIAIGDSKLSENTMVGRLTKLKGLVYDTLKMHIFYNVTKKTATTSGRQTITLNRIRGTNACSEGDIEFSIFGQYASQARVPGTLEALKQNLRAWTTSFIGEGSIDAGGPYRECFAVLSTELHSGNHILRKCPNGRFGMGVNRDRYLPVASFDSPKQLEWYKMLGVLMGITLRTKGSLEINFPALIWKPLVGIPATAQDLKDIDETSMNAIRSIREIDQEGVDADMFEDIFFEVFTTFLPDGSEVELCENGKNIDLTFHNRHEYCDLVLYAQLHCYDKQIAAMREGINAIVPLNIIDGLFTWKQLQLQICGRPSMDVDLLKSQTDYSSFSATDSTILYLWTSLEAMTPVEQSLFLRFVWGRTRLPLTVSGFEKRFTIEQSLRTPTESVLPEACTCFFKLKLPPYQSYETLNEKMMYAIRNCVAIDADSEVVDRSGWS
eukprot:TRINITY_DN7896_c0_g1_i1.p1 TRINITY_DN7896_c0_g1~~TRINITY_DN7896_c0_g1_i1.p1  ORF type:complete len:901 (+),score=202.86 TRINITY_DN7896_c0_g1_i1:271-2703(+)